MCRLQAEICKEHHIDAKTLEQLLLKYQNNPQIQEIMVEMEVRDETTEFAQTIIFCDILLGSSKESTSKRGIIQPDPY